MGVVMGVGKRWNMFLLWSRVVNHRHSLGACYNYSTDNREIRVPW